MGSRKQQQHVGIPAKRRGQQMGVSGQDDRNRKIIADSPTVRGLEKQRGKLFADESFQQISSSSTTQSTNSPSTTAVIAGGRPGETSGETAFKRRLAKQRPK